MRILAIETSCDETAIALLEITGGLEKPEIKVLGNTLLSQMHLHEKYGGVFPTLAKREHQKNLPVLLEEITKDHPQIASEIDFIAVTSGPGLEPALWTGIAFAEDLGKRWSKPVVPVNHMKGHIYSVLYKLESNPKSEASNPKLELPALALLVSGGHTELVHVKDFGNYEIMGRTRDDAVGEAFDKTARMLGLPYPGGPRISALAESSRQKGKEDKIKLPRPMFHSGDLDFSFSGLKTAVLYRLKENGELNDEIREDMARAFEDSAVEVLVEKTRRALLSLGDEVKTFIVAGGVSANTHLVRELRKLESEFSNIKLLIPTKLLTTDNAIMIGIAGFVEVEKNPRILESKKAIEADGNLSISSTQ